MKKSIAILCVVWLLYMVPGSYANNVTVSSVQLVNQDLTDQYCLIQFNIYWNNSWRTTAVPQNWDAAWVFVKFSDNGGPWQHATLDSVGINVPAGAVIDITPDGIGAFIYRDSEGSGTFSLTDVGLRWNYGDNGVADDASVEVKVFAVEMVYVPQESFYLGDGGSAYTFHEYPTSTNPFLVDGSPITIGMTAGNLYATGSIPAPGLVPSDYPTGYDAYYCMKYEMSQEQYVDFLNTLTRDQQNQRTSADVSGDAPGAAYVLSNNATVFCRSGVSCPASGNGMTDPITFHCDFDGDGNGNESNDGQNIACNYITWMDLAAYADWAGLRPMTEPEFEKVCRGPNTPVTGEHAWGNTNYHSNHYTATNLGYPNEGISDLGVSTGNMMHVMSKNGFGGPARCGIFAASSSSHTRIETGAGYYGIMELSGNLKEMTVTLGTVAGNSYTGLHGDGSLTNEGDANTDHWPGINGNTNSGNANGTYSASGVTAAAGAGDRGGAWDNLADDTFVSNRTYSNYTTVITSHNIANGGRLVRTAP